MKHRVTLFRPYPFQVGQKIHIESGPRRGDWQVLEVTDSKVRLQCPISGKAFFWNRFCYDIEEQEAVEWPRQD